MTRPASLPGAYSCPPSTPLGPKSTYPFERAALHFSLACVQAAIVVVVRTSSINIVAMVIVTVTLHDYTWADSCAS